MIIDQIPFYFKFHAKPDNGGYPQTLPFLIKFDEELKMYRQIAYPELNNLLRQVYETGSLVEGSLSNESGLLYLEKVVGYLVESNMLNGKQILEIGCGSGSLLKELKKNGGKVIGLEPGSHKRVEGIDDIRIIKDFFPSNEIKEKFDLIIHFGVLEHIENPLAFISAQKENLNPDGKIFFAVPNCEPFFESGDISIFIHEHFNYFTSESISLLIKKAGLYMETCFEVEGMLAVIVTRNKTSNFTLVKRPNYLKFEANAIKLNKKISDLFKNVNENDIAIYVGIRALNSMFLINKCECRLIDDNSEVHGKYLPFFKKPIESFSDLIKSPPKYLLIYSRTFGERIKLKCIERVEFKNTKIITLKDFDES
jgi:2-polyprenyl-3-methyl-5-hydroxy-6-metoxy-1,4-benzoquinol methylase